PNNACGAIRTLRVTGCDHLVHRGACPERFTNQPEQDGVSVRGVEAAAGGIAETLDPQFPCPGCRLWNTFGEILDFWEVHIEACAAPIRIEAQVDCGVLRPLQRRQMGAHEFLDSCSLVFVSCPVALPQL